MNRATLSPEEFKRLVTQRQQASSDVKTLKTKSVCIPNLIIRVTNNQLFPAQQITGLTWNEKVNGVVCHLDEALKLIEKAKPEFVKSHVIDGKSIKVPFYVDNKLKDEVSLHKKSNSLGHD